MGQTIVMDDFQTLARTAEAEMRGVFAETPLQKNAHLSAMYDADIWLKREDLSPVRSYKLRGAFNAMRKLTEIKGNGTESNCNDIKLLKLVFERKIKLYLERTS